MNKIILFISFLLSWTLTPAQDSLFTNAERPALSEGGPPLTVGMVFQSKTEGTITHVRVWKSYASDATTYIVRIWTADGQELTTQTYPATGPTGWRRVALAKPVRIEQFTNYVVGVFYPGGMYSSRLEFFTVDRVRKNLTAPASSKAGGNGRYLYASTAGFPNSSSRAQNYYVDVVFSERHMLIVNAGRDTSYALPRDTIKLKGVVSGDGTFYTWDIVDSLTYPENDSLTVVMHNSKTLTPFVTGFGEGVYTFSLTGWDRYGERSRSLVQIMVTENPGGVMIEILKDGTWRVIDNKKLFLLKTSQ